MPASNRNVRENSEFLALQAKNSEYLALQVKYRTIKNMSVQLLQKIPQPNCFLQAIQVGPEINEGIEDVRMELTAAQAILGLSASPIASGSSSSTKASPQEVLSPWKTINSKKTT